MNKPPRKAYPPYYLRICHGMLASGYFRLLARNRFAVSPTRIPFALQVCIYSVINSLLTLVETAFFADRIARSEIGEPPVFIIGHWRSGTTYLHELLVLDENLIAPSTRECFAPGHFLISGWLFPMLGLFLPPTRPMDDMRIGWDRPQEDEFALLNLGFGSPYETLIFPNRRPAGIEFLDMAEIAPEQVQAWQAGLLKFLKRVQFANDRKHADPVRTRRLVLKSPPHTARLRILRQLFPEAQFIHLVRHPFDVFQSTVRLWNALWDTQALQKPRHGQVANRVPTTEEYVLETMDLLYRDFLSESVRISSKNFCQVRYEDLARSPMAEMARIYKCLGLGPFEHIQSRLEAHLVTRLDYKRSEHAISEDEKAEVRRRWRWYMERFDYDPFRS